MSIRSKDYFSGIIRTVRDRKLSHELEIRLMYRVQKFDSLPAVGGESGMWRSYGYSQKELPMRYPTSRLAIAHTTNPLSRASQRLLNGHLT
jgi:hypothetical protein